jgi:hypothetical protein
MRTIHTEVQETLAMAEDRVANVERENPSIGGNGVVDADHSAKNPANDEHNRVETEAPEELTLLRRTHLRDFSGEGPRRPLA